MKRCPACGDTKALDAFAVDRHRYDGRLSWCKACDNARAKARYYDSKRREPKVCTKCRQTKDPSEFPSHKKTNDRLSSWCKACHSEAARRSQAKPGSAANRRRLERLAATADRRAQRQLDKAKVDAYFAALRTDPCAYCCGTGGEADHIDAAAKNGTDDWTNRTGACRSCNAAKKDMDLLNYMLARPLWLERATIDEQLRRLAA